MVCRAYRRDLGLRTGSPLLVGLGKDLAHVWLRHPT